MDIFLLNYEIPEVPVRSVVTFIPEYELHKCGLVLYVFLQWLNPPVKLNKLGVDTSAVYKALKQEAMKEDDELWRRLGARELDVTTTNLHVDYTEKAICKLTSRRSETFHRSVS